jgi:hypothetical protein
MTRCIFSFLFVVVLFACRPQEQSKETPHTEADWLFEKKMRCSSLRDGLEGKVRGSQAFLASVFYSPSLNTCVYATTTNPPGAKFAIIDALTGENIFFANSDLSTKASPDFEAKIAELKSIKPNDPLGIR